MKCMSANKGFTLVELLVSIAIFAMITTLVLTKYQSFNGGIVLTNLAYELALTIRQAQTYGINVKGSSAGFNVSYGVHFDASTPGSFILFADARSSFDPDSLTSSGDGKYPTAGDALVDTFNLRRGIVISKFCIGQSLANIANADGSNKENCTTSGGTLLDITFSRPDPAAVINYTGAAGPVNGNGYARIQVRATGNGAIKDIIVQKTGQISIQNGQ